MSRSRDWLDASFDPRSAGIERKRRGALRVNIAVSFGEGGLSEES
jgi:hypothetical protein